VAEVAALDEAPPVWLELPAGADGLLVCEAGGERYW